MNQPFLCRFPTEPAPAEVAGLTVEVLASYTDDVQWSVRWHAVPRVKRYVFAPVPIPRLGGMLQRASRVGLQGDGALCARQAWPPSECPAAVAA